MILVTRQATNNFVGLVMMISGELFVVGILFYEVDSNTMFATAVFLIAHRENFKNI